MLSLAASVIGTLLRGMPALHLDSCYPAGSGTSDARGENV